MVRTAVVSASVTLHAAAIAALALAALWRMDKIPLEDRGAIRAPFTLPAAAPPGGAPKQARPEAAPRKTRPRDTVQPTRTEATPTSAATETTAAATPGTGATDVAGDGPGTDPDATGVTGTCTGPLCGPGEDDGEERCPDGSKPPCKKKKPVTVTPKIATALRTSGNERIHAPDAVRVQMRHAGQSKLTGVFHLCIDAGGDVASVRALRSTGYDAYDDEIVTAMRAWDYRPYRVDGDAYPFCYAVTIVYVMK